MVTNYTRKHNLAHTLKLVGPKLKSTKSDVFFFFRTLTYNLYI